MRPRLLILVIATVGMAAAALILCGRGEWAPVMASLANVLILGATAVVVVYYTAETRELAQSTRSMAESTRAMAEAQASAEVVLKHEAEGTARDAQPRVINYVPGPALAVRVFGDSDQPVWEKPILRPGDRPQCQATRGRLTVVVRWTDYLGRDQSRRFTREAASDHWTGTPDAQD